MKQLILLVSILFCGTSAMATAPEIGGEQYVEVVQTVSDPVTYQPDPTTISVETSAGRNVDGSVRRNTYSFPFVPQSRRDPNRPDAISATQAYESLSPEDRLIFQEKRMMALQRVANVLEMSSLGLGMGSYAGSQLKWLTKLLPSGKPTPDPIDMIVEATLPDEIRNPRTFNDHRKKVVYEFLRAYDEQMGRDAVLVSQENEFDVSIGLNVGGTAAVMGRLGVTLSMGLGLTIAYNHDSRESMFEVFTQFETFKRAFTPVLALGVVPMFEIEGRAQPEQGAMRNIRVNAIYPPVVPGMTTNGARSHSFAISDGTFTGPFSTFSNAFSFETDRRRQVIFRTSVSFISKWLIRVQNLGRAGQELVAMTYSMFNRQLREERARARASRANFCRRTFSDDMN